LWPLKVVITWPVEMSHNLIDLSSLPETIWGPWTCRDFTAALWEENVWSSALEAKFHSFRVVSELPEMIWEPSKERHWMSDWWPKAH
jgi:hypothetical protein